jgi:hypothetical protein
LQWSLQCWPQAQCRHTSLCGGPASWWAYFHRVITQQSRGVGSGIRVLALGSWAGTALSAV